MSKEEQVRKILSDTYTMELTQVAEEVPLLAPIHRFGQRQNAFNRSAEERIAVIQNVCRRQQREINALYDEKEYLKEQLRIERRRTKSLFTKMEADMRIMKAEMNRMRLSTHLNSLAIDRLVNRTDAETEQADAESLDLPELLPDAAGTETTPESETVADVTTEEMEHNT